MNEVEIPLKITGIGAMKAELRELKGAIANATDPEAMEQLARRAGEVADRLKDANEQVAVFTAGSKFESISNSFAGISGDIASLDFEGASEKAKVFAKNLGSLNPADIGKGFKDFTEVLGIVSKAFIKLGLTILMNPIFLIVAAVVAIIAVVALVLKSFGVLDIVLKALMAPINALIDGFYAMTDAIGLTTHAAEENAEKTLAANEKVVKSSEERTARVVSDLNREIAEAKARGEDTKKLEIERSDVQIKEAGIRKETAKKALADQKKLGDNADAKVIEDLNKQIAKETEIRKQGYSDKRIAKINADKKEAEDAEKIEKENASKAKAASDEATKKRIAGDKASEDEIATAAKLVSDSKKTAQQKELDDVASDYKKRIANAKQFGNDSTALVEAQKIQEDAINKKYADTALAVANKELLAKKENDLLLATTDDAKFTARIAQLEAEASVKLQNETLTAAEIKNINDKLAQDLAGIETQKTAKVFESNKLKIDAEKLRQESALLVAGFELERFKGNKDEEVRLNSEFLAKQLATLDAQKLAELNNLDLSELEKEAIREKYRQAKITAEEATAKKIEEIEAEAQAKTLKNINEGFETTKQALSAITSVQEISTRNKLKNVEKGSKQEEAILKQQFEQQKKMNLAMAAINGAQAILAILSVPDFTLGIASGIRIAASIAATAASISAISATSFEGGGNAPSPVSGGTTQSNVGQMATPNLFGNSNNANNVGNNNNTNDQSTPNFTVTAVVSETEMTSTQNRVKRIQRNAEL
jgi:hypothetical protein